MPIRTARKSDQFPLRLPDGMRDQLKDAAEASGRSTNAEIVARLERSFQESCEMSEIVKAAMREVLAERDNPR